MDRRSICSRVAGAMTPRRVGALLRATLFVLSWFAGTAATAQTLEDLTSVVVVVQATIPNNDQVERAVSFRLFAAGLDAHPIAAWNSTTPPERPMPASKFWIDRSIERVVVDVWAVPERSDPSGSANVRIWSRESPLASESEIEDAVHGIVTEFITEWESATGTAARRARKLRGLQNLGREAEFRFAQDHEQCLNAFGHVGFCDCLRSSVPVGVGGFLGYVVAVASPLSDAKMARLDEDSRRLIEMSIAARDKCVASTIKGRNQ